MSIELNVNSISDFEPDNLVNQIPYFPELITERKSLLKLHDEISTELHKNLCKTLQDYTDLSKKKPLKNEILIDNQTIQSVLKQYFKTLYLFEKNVLIKTIEHYCIQILNGKMNNPKEMKSFINKRIKHIDITLTEQLKKIMHAKPFRKLESAWRGLEFVVSRITESTLINIKILNFKKHLLIEDFEDSPSHERSFLYQIIYKDNFDTIGTKPFNMLIAGHPS